MKPERLAIYIAIGFLALVGVLVFVLLPGNLHPTVRHPVEVVPEIVEEVKIKPSKVIIPCSECNGTGSRDGGECWACQGSGKLVRWVIDPKPEPPAPEDEPAPKLDPPLPDKPADEAKEAPEPKYSVRQYPAAPVQRRRWRLFR